jgi:hypothetical protein
MRLEFWGSEVGDLIDPYMLEDICCYSLQARGVGKSSKDGIVH